MAGAGIALGLSLAGAAAAQSSTPQTPPQDPSDEATANLDEVVVTGTRRSLEDALSTKRRSASIIDSI